MKKIVFLILLFSLYLFLPSSADAETLTERLSGHISGVSVVPLAR